MRSVHDDGLGVDRDRVCGPFSIGAENEAGRNLHTTAAAGTTSRQLPYQPTDFAVAPACTATQRRTQPPNKSATFSSIDLIQYLSLCLLFEE